MPERPATYRDLIEAEAKKARISPALAFALVDQESSGRAGALSPKGARGFFQLMPETARELGVDPTDPVQNIRGGITYLRQQLDLSRGPDGLFDVGKALALYHGGPDLTQHGPKTRQYVTDILTRLQDTRAQPTPSTTPTTSTAPTTGVGTAPPRGFLRGLKEAVVPSFTELKELAQAAYAHPIGTALAMGRGIAAESGEQLRRAKTAAQEFLGAPPFSATQAAAGLETVGRVGAAIPLIGPAAAKAGEALGGEEPAYGAGQAVGLIGTAALGPALRGVRGTKVTKGAIPLTRGERTGSALSRFAESLVEKSIPGRTRFAQFRARQQEAVLGAVDQAIDKIAPRTGEAQAAYRTGEGAVAAIELAKEAFKKPIQTRYGQIDELTKTEMKRVPVVTEVPATIVGPSGEALTVPKRTLQKTEVGGLQPETRSLKEAAIPILRRVRQESKLIPPEELKSVTSTLERIVNAPKRLSYRAFQDARSDLLAIARRHGDPIPGKAGGLAKRLASVTDKAMEEAVEASGMVVQTPEGAVLLQRFVRETNKLWAEAEDVFNESLLAKMVEQAPERVHLLLPQATLDDITTIKRFMPREQVQGMKAQLVKEWFSKDVQGEALVPGVKGLPSIGGPNVRGQTFTRQVEQFGKDRLTALFGADESRELLSLARTAEDIARRRGDSVAGLIAGGLNANLVYIAPASILTGIATGPSVGTAGAYLVGTNLAARLMTRPEGITGLRRFVRALGTGRIPELNLASMQLRRILEQQETTGQQTAVGQPPSSARPTGTTTGVGSPPPR